MPLFDLKVLGSAMPHVGKDSICGVAEVLADKLSVLGVRAMNQVAGGVLHIEDGVQWPVRGTYLEPLFSRGARPLTVEMHMNPIYRGFDFGDHLVPLHRAFRENIWAALCEIATSEYVVLGGPRGGHRYGQHAFTVRLVCGVAVGSDVLEDGQVVDEYGGDTGVRRLERA